MPSLCLHYHMIFVCISHLLFFISPIYFEKPIVKKGKSSMYRKLKMRMRMKNRNGIQRTKNYYLSSQQFPLVILILVFIFSSIDNDDNTTTSHYRYYVFVFFSHRWWWYVQYKFLKGKFSNPHISHPSSGDIKADALFGWDWGWH